MKNVIEFPKSKTKKARALRRTESKQAVIALSVVTLIMGFVLVNDAMTKTERTSYLISDNGSQIQNLNRAIASAKPMNPFRDLQWEQNLAKKLGKEVAIDERVPASVGRKITSLEELQLSTLKWKYAVLNQPVGEEILVKEINYVESQDVAEQPEFINPETFLNTYKELWVTQFSKVKMVQNPPPLAAEAADMNYQKIYKLLNEADQVVGEAVFVFNSEDRFLSLKINPISVQ